MSESIKKKYGSQTLDKIICYFMRTILHLQNTGIEDLPLRNELEEPIKSFLDVAVDLILDSEYDVLLSEKQINMEIVLCLQFIKELSWHIHFDKDYYGYLLSTDNLWGNDVFEYASRTFYPNLPEEIKDKYRISDLIKYIPPEMFRLEDY